MHKNSFCLKYATLTIQKVIKVTFDQNKLQFKNDFKVSSLAIFDLLTNKSIACKQKLRVIKNVIIFERSKTMIIKYLSLESKKTLIYELTIHL